MVFKLGDRVRETSTTTGTGALSLAGAAVGYQSFASVLANGDTCWYAVAMGPHWEVGIGSFATGSPSTLARSEVLVSSNGGAAVNFPAGDKDVFITTPAGALEWLASVSADGKTLVSAPSFSAQRAVLGVRSVAVGEVIRGQFTSLPPLCVWANGQNLSRATYALLLAATTLAATTATTSGSANVTLDFGSAANLTEQVQVGMPIEGAGIQAGSTVSAIGTVTGNTIAITLSANATATASGVAVRVFPNGNGNGSTTFGVADYRDRAAVARGNMGGTAAGRVTFLNTSALGRGGGDQRPAPQTQTGRFGNSNPVGVDWIDFIPGNSISYGASADAGTNGTGTQGNIQPSIIENVAIYAGV